MARLMAHMHHLSSSQHVFTVWHSGLQQFFSFTVCCVRKFNFLGLQCCVGLAGSKTAVEPCSLWQCHYDYHTRKYDMESSSHARQLSVRNLLFRFLHRVHFYFHSATTCYGGFECKGEYEKITIFDQF